MTIGTYIGTVFKLFREIYRFRGVFGCRYFVALWRFRVFLGVLSRSG